ncbi:OpgC domain-containing protein [Mangrovitalea sediminis]|uniref:OpgC domain-containing protein n=1 Tax=Mangrovitalea sediminis TaxID=1982043 RepID=UPI000BE5C96B|nr:OpgC domain-containing protein [Mangrovitalea sediminis]
MNRDLRIDTLRGILLVIMTIDHLGGWLARITSETLGYVSALEGFIFLSAFVFAMVYVRYVNDPRMMWRKSLSRALVIYRYHLILLATIPLLLWLSPEYRLSLANWINPYLQHPLYYGAYALMMLHQPVYMDILPIYFVFVVLSPLLLLAFRRGAGPAVILISVLIWALSQSVNPVKFLAGTACDHCRYGFLNLFAWQLIWVSGLYLGYLRQSGKPLLKALSRPWAGALLIAVAAVLFMTRHQLIDVGLRIGPWIDRENLGVLRILNFFVVVTLIGLLIQRWPRTAGIPWLSFIGRYSLQVFAFHVFLSYLILPYRSVIANAAGPIGYSLFTLLVVASLTLPAWIYHCYQKRQAEGEARSFVRIRKLPW